MTRGPSIPFTVDVQSLRGQRRSDRDLGPNVPATNGNRRHTPSGRQVWVEAAHNSAGTSWRAARDADAHSHPSTRDTSLMSLLSTASPVSNMSETTTGSASFGRVAIVHDYLNQRGGAEKVVLEMSNMWPQAPIYTSLYRPGSTFEEFRGRDVRTSFIDREPVDRGFRNLFPLYPAAFWAVGEI